MILSFVYYVMPAAATCFRHSAHDSGHYDFISYFIYLSIYYLVPASAACARHSAAA
jgi:hypothetical protein